MSNAALTWAFKQDIRPATRKFVLVALADAANHDGECWPAIPTLSTMTSLDRKTVVSALADLERAGVICDTGKRVGATRQIPIYRLAGFINGGEFTGKISAPDAINGTENGTVLPPYNSPENGPVCDNSTENGTVPFLTGNSTVFPAEQYRFSAVTVPFSGHGTLRNHNGTQREPGDGEERVNAPSPSAPLPPADTPSDGLSKSKPAKAEVKPFRLPADWQPSESLLEWAARDHPGVNVDLSVARFRDHWASTGGPNAKKIDWDAAFRNWLRRDAERSPLASTVPPYVLSENGGAHFASNRPARPARPAPPTEAEGREDIRKLFQNLVNEGDDL